MTKYLLTLYIIILMSTLTANGQKGYNEGTVFLKPIFYLNNIDIKYTSGNTQSFYTRSTISNSLNVQYTRITKDKILLSSGFGLGERHYYLNSTQGQIANARIFYLNWDLNIGYRFTDKEKIKLEIRAGNLTNTALGEVRLSARQFNSNGTLGRNGEGNGTTMIQYLQWNIRLHNKVMLGLQVERKLLDSKQEINYVAYSMNRNGIDVYNSSQTGVAIMVGLVF